MARKRASMREGPLAELFKATEAAQRKAEQDAGGAPKESAESRPPEETVEHAPDFAEESRASRHLEPVESVVVDIPRAPVPAPAEEPARERLRPELWDVAPEPPVLHAVP